MQDPSVYAAAPTPSLGACITAVAWMAIMWGRFCIHLVMAAAAATARADSRMQLPPPHADATHSVLAQLDVCAAVSPETVQLAYEHERCSICLAAFFPLSPDIGDQGVVSVHVDDVDVERPGHAAAAAASSHDAGRITSSRDKTVCLLSCYHAFHRSCLREWLLSSLRTAPDAEPRCPLCRALPQPLQWLPPLPNSAEPAAAAAPVALLT